MKKRTTILLLLAVAATLCLQRCTNQTMTPKYEWEYSGGGVFTDPK